jgi:hypothetical protein
MNSHQRRGARRKWDKMVRKIMDDNKELLQDLAEMEEAEKRAATCRELLAPFVEALKVNPLVNKDGI